MNRSTCDFFFSKNRPTGDFFRHFFSDRDFSIKPLPPPRFIISLFVSQSRLETFAQKKTNKKKKQATLRLESLLATWKSVPPSMCTSILEYSTSSLLHSLFPLCAIRGSGETFSFAFSFFHYIGGFGRQSRYVVARQLHTVSAIPVWWVLNEHSVCVLHTVFTSFSFFTPHW